MSKKPADKLAAKRVAWLERTGQALGTTEAETLQLLNQERRQSVRLNPLVAKPADTLAKLRKIGWLGGPYTWAKNCYTIDEGALAVRDSDLITRGAVYLQNTASWVPVLALDPQSGETILDMCAAPGGKASHIAALTNNQADLTVNDNSRARLAKMRANLDRLGVQADYTLYDATQLARKLDGQQFDKILLDAPCSGEGLMRYDRDKDFATWSVAHIKRLQPLQKQLILQAWQLLKPGGTLVYSTCTMAPEENEAVVDYLLRKRPSASIQALRFELPNRVEPVTSWNDRVYAPEVQACLRLQPSQNIEAFFVAAFQKTFESDAD
ncbi:MAG TPA: RsmB/NOP family class I SAM-dependent RNA methyltransferase [Candidatus Saccharimonadales bacterium]|nr:RsmB/NOP family class I SAM-dependent RNA methyltransferase [Candidatus Saccharimonadales bacterium]